jgi:phosphoribosyl-ATP pyrophosphohydrolase/phosphoribosyl-AMP cyclohydrolase
MKDSDLAFLTKLENIITERRTSPVDSSYTSSLFADGTKRIAQKVGEEAVEVALASAMGDRSETTDEAADLIYHLLVLLANQEIALSEVVAKLQSRHKA